eukprot:3941588-Rhodomonas_salina.1
MPGGVRRGGRSGVGGLNRCVSRRQCHEVQCSNTAACNVVQHSRVRYRAAVLVGYNVQGARERGSACAVYNV